MKNQAQPNKKSSPVGVDGWVDGWVEGSKSQFKDCLQQSINNKEIMNQLFYLQQFSLFSTKN